MKVGRPRSVLAAIAKGRVRDLDTLYRPVGERELRGRVVPFAPMRFITLLVVLAACGKDLPTFTPELMPPSARPLMLGSSTEADLMAKLASLPEEGLRVSKDKAHGGTGHVAFNDHPSIAISHPAFGEAWLWDMGGTPKLGKLTLSKSEGCAWVVENIAKLEGSRECPGNRKTGGNAQGGYWCASLDGHTIHVDCSPTTIDMFVGRKR